MTGIYDWEFDGTVDFAPYNYRIGKYKECKALGEKIQDEESALSYLKLFKYVDYLAENHMNEIPCYNELVEYEEMALSLIESKNAIYEWIVYPIQHKIWKNEFDNLREEEKDVLNKDTDITVEQYINKVVHFNNATKLINQANKKEYDIKHNSHNLYWVQDMMLKHKMRKLLMPFPKDFHEKIEYLELNGVTRKEDWHRR